MGAFNPRKFVNPDTLKRVSFGNLVLLLTKTAGAYLSSAGDDGAPRVDLGADEASFDYDRLAYVLLHPDDGYPDDLADALHHIAELADGEGVELLQEQMGDALDLSKLGEEPTPADIALRAWLLDRNAVEVVLGRQFLDRQKSFTSFLGPDLRGPKLPKLTEATLDPLVRYLKAWYLQKKGSDFVRVLPYERGDATWFLVRHAMPPRREAVVKDGKPTSTVERPEKHDVVIYTPERDELAIHAATKGEEKLYCEAFGLHLFREGRAFTDKGKYSLKPLVDDGVESLSVHDVEGIDSIVLTRLQEVLGPGVVRTIAAPDVFAFYAAKGWSFPRAPMSATFDVKFANVKKARKLTIRPKNVAKYNREGDKDLIDQWMTRRRFIDDRGGSEDRKTG